MFRILAALALLLPLIAGGCSSEQAAKQADNYARDGGLVPPKTVEPFAIIR